MPISGLEQRVHTVVDEILLAAHAGDMPEAQRLAHHHQDIGALLIVELATRIPPKRPVADDVYANRRQRVEQVRAMQAAGVPDRVIQARMARQHRPDRQDAS